MRVKGIGRLLVVLLCVLALLGTTTCLANEETDPGDPVDYPPGCTSPDPAPAVFSDVLILLVVLMSQTWL